MAAEPTGDNAVDQISSEDAMDTPALADAVRQRTRESRELGQRAAIDEYTGPRRQGRPLVPVEYGPVSKSAPFHPTPSLDPAVITKGIEGYEDAKELLAPVATAFSAATNALIDIHKAKLQAQKDPSRTEANVLLQVAKFAEQHQEKITKKFDAVLKTLDAQIKSREAMLSAPLKSAANSSIVATEVRAHIKAMSPEKRAAFLNERQKAGDTETLSMILGAQGFLSGMSDQERAVRTRMFNEAQNPLVSRQLKAMQAARDTIEARAPLVFDQVTKAMGADWKKIQRLREAHTAAEQAFIVRDHTVDVTS